MKLLVLGGTRFLGRAIVEAALAGGNEVSIFTRGQTNSDLFPEASSETATATSLRSREAAGTR